jgi:serine/threonine protein kinase
LDIQDLEFVQPLGSGTSGEVFKGKYRGTTTVAIKVLKALSDDTTEEEAEFIREFQIAVQVQSEHVVHLYGATTKGKLCMVMEFCERGSLYNLLKDDSVCLGWENSFSMLKEICLGLLALHSNDPVILHRDLKTLNVLVTNDFHCKICDFGLSRFDTSSNVKTLNKCRGTYAYIAPEVYHNTGYQKQSDTYSIAIMMWEFVNKLLTGEYRRPYHDVKLEFRILLLAHTDKQQRPEIPASTPQSLKDLITQTWDPDLEKRPNAKQLYDRLEDIYTNEYLPQKSTWDSLVKARPKITRKKGAGNLLQLEHKN